MGSIKLPGIVDTAITKAKEILAFAVLPYYQASGVLKDAEGAVLIGDPIAWNTATKEYIKFDAGATDVVDEAVGNGDGTTVVFWLANDYIKEGSVIIEVVDDGVDLVEGIDYVVDYKSGQVYFKVAPVNAKAITATYTHYANAAGAKGKCVGIVRIPGDSTAAAVAIEVLIGGAVKYSVISVATNYDSKILTDLGAKYWEIADAIIW